MAMLYELRTYHCLPGRLNDLIGRFREHTLGFFDRYGIRYEHFCTTVIGPSNMTLSYVLVWESLAERDSKWGAFQADAEWQAIRSASEISGPIVERIENTILSPIELRPAGPGLSSRPGAVQYA
jgi:NIPSNAP